METLKYSGLQSIVQMESRYEELKEKTYKLKELSLGSIQEKWKKCGDPDCRCARGKKHGPYYYLAYTDRDTGKTTTVYLQEEELPELRERIQNYEKFKEELRELVEIEVELRRG
ncbi:hypothetical protein AKJ53_00955 [candidate division MSBL1 archaeon SCGC-AAA382F02]|uniref:DUF6788 domain-containing protein n=1 Tax=candidate division MSBL1 archaeon SCGC-AAA382F02 TaxID=1698282 RepID=A0A133VII6_9EURY|nr:hypothetical protein AKJ53_00955 [candidate division MSBL1 archaeon SCGC-AAA382F02]